MERAATFAGLPAIHLPMRALRLIGSFLQKACYIRVRQHVPDGGSDRSTSPTADRILTLSGGGEPVTGERVLCTMPAQATKHLIGMASLPGGRAAVGCFLDPRRGFRKTCACFALQPPPAEDSAAASASASASAATAYTDQQALHAADPRLVACVERILAGAWRPCGEDTAVTLESDAGAFLLSWVACSPLPLARGCGSCPGVAGAEAASVQGGSAATTAAPAPLRLLRTLSVPHAGLALDSPFLVEPAAIYLVSRELTWTSGLRVCAETGAVLSEMRVNDTDPTSALFPLGGDAWLFTSGERVSVLSPGQPEAPQPELSGALTPDKLWGPLRGAGRQHEGQQPPGSADSRFLLHDSVSGRFALAALRRGERRLRVLDVVACDQASGALTDRGDLVAELSPPPGLVLRGKNGTSIVVRAGGDRLSVQLAGGCFGPVAADRGFVVGQRFEQDPAYAQVLAQLVRQKEARVGRRSRSTARPPPT